MTEIDPKFVDVDLAEAARKLGIPPGYAVKPQQLFSDPGAGVCYEDEFEILPDAERTKAIEKMDAEGGLENLVRWILNQKSEGSCVGNAWTQATMVKMAEQLGEANAIHLSAISGYKQIGRSPGSGADIGDALERGTDTGLLPLDTPENRARFGNMVMPATGFYTPWPDGDWKAVAKQFRIVKRRIVRSIAGVEQAGINRHPIVVGRAGHSICYLRPTLKSGRGEIYANSWSEDWGSPMAGHKGGFGLDTGRLVSSSASWCWAIISVTVPDFVQVA